MGHPYREGKRSLFQNESETGVRPVMSQVTR
jgi:hypothetical protein